MTTLQINLPEALLVSPDELSSLTGRSTRPAQLAWLKEHGWAHEIAADGRIVVGQLYAHMRLAGVRLEAAGTGGVGSGFNLAATR